MSLRDKRLHSDYPPPKASSPPELQRLIQELKTHQIELEAQNDELRLAQRLLAEQKDKFCDLFDFAPVAFFVIDRFHLISECNLTAAGMVRTERSLLINRPFRQLVVPEDQDTFFDFMGQPHPRQQGQSREFGMLRMDGSRFYARAEVDAVRGESDVFRLAIMDISDRFQAEQALLEAKRELEQKVQQRTAELASTVDELRMRAKQLQGLTHQLIETEHRERKRIAQILHDSLQQQLAAAKLALGGLIEGSEVKEEAIRIEELIGDSIRTTRSLTSELSPPALSQGLGPGLEWLAKWFEQKHGLKIKISIEGGQLDLHDNSKMLLFDSTRELLFNVVKHSGATTARLQLEAEDGFIKVTVSDRGRGFDPQKPPPNQEGGFGLFSIKERLQSLDGQLTCNSAPGEGSRFTLIIPHEPPSAPGSERSIRLLLVDDHSAIREGLARLLGRERDLEVVGQASDGQAAIELAKKLLPSLILMDVEMPGIDGIEATRRIRAELPQAKIIGFTMHNEERLEQSMRDAGAAGYLSKSCSLDQLIGTIRACASERTSL